MTSVNQRALACLIVVILTGGAYGNQPCAVGEKERTAVVETILKTRIRRHLKDGVRVAIEGPIASKELSALRRRYDIVELKEAEDRRKTAQAITYYVIRKQWCEKGQLMAEVDFVSGSSHGLAESATVYRMSKRHGRWQSRIVRRQASEGANPLSPPRPLSQGYHYD